MLQIEVPKKPVMAPQDRVCRVRQCNRQQERDALSTAFKEQMEEKERRRREQLAEEGQFRQELYAKFAREAKLEQMTLQRRKLALLEHNRQVSTGSSKGSQSYA